MRLEVRDTNSGEVLWRAPSDYALELGKLQQREHAADRQKPSEAAEPGSVQGRDPVDVIDLSTETKPNPAIGPERADGPSPTYDARPNPAPADALDLVV